jgi:hypothetical protein
MVATPMMIKEKRLIKIMVRCIWFLIESEAVDQIIRQLKLD